MTDTVNKNIIPFWTDDPNIIFNQQYIFEFFPTEKMTYEQKLNAVSRSVILLTILSFIFTQNIRVLAVSFITLFAIYILHKQQTKAKTKATAEHFQSNGGSGGTNGGWGEATRQEEMQDQIVKDVLKQNNAKMVPKSDVFDTPNETNPLSNVLMTDYDFNPNKKPAPPSYNETIAETINGNAKKMVEKLNHDQTDIADKLFKDLGDELYFEQSMRQFYTNPNTTIPNDQNSFADFCYGNMVSCKEGNLFACARNMARHTNG